MNAWIDAWIVSARLARDNARRWRSYRDDHDDAWRDKCDREVAACFERARWYLGRERLRRQFQQHEDFYAHVA